MAVKQKTPEVKASTKWYKVLQESFINESFKYPGEYVQYTGVAGSNLEEVSEKEVRDAGVEIETPDEDLLENREIELNKREKDLIEREKKVQIREKELEELDDAINDRAEELDEREKAISVQEQVLVPVKETGDKTAK